MPKFNSDDLKITYYKNDINEINSSKNLKNDLDYLNNITTDSSTSWFSFNWIYSFFDSIKNSLSKLFSPSSSENSSVKESISTNNINTDPILPKEIKKPIIKSKKELEAEKKRNQEIEKEQKRNYRSDNYNEITKFKFRAGGTQQNQHTATTWRDLNGSGS